MLLAENPSWDVQKADLVGFAGLYLPTSDMDVVVINSGCTDIPRALRGIGNLLVEKGMGKEIQVAIYS